MYQGEGQMSQKIFFTLLEKISKKIFNIPFENLKNLKNLKKCINIAKILKFKRFSSLWKSLKISKTSKISKKSSKNLCHLFSKLFAPWFPKSQNRKIAQKFDENRKTVFETWPTWQENHFSSNNEIWWPLHDLIDL